MGPVEAALLVAIGFVIGTYATAIGAGGGFLIAPFLLIRHPDVEPVTITTASLSVVLASALSSTIITVRDRLIDVKMVLAMAAIGIPCAVAGGLVTNILPRDVFAVGFAVLVGAIGVYLIWRPVAGIVAPARHAWRRSLTDSSGNSYVYRIPVLNSIGPIVGSAFLGALAGIGGGPIGMPILTRVMRVPHPIATCSIQALIVLQSGIVVFMHLALGHSGEPMQDAVWLAIGGIAGSPVGRYGRRHLGEGPLTKLLAVGLFFIALRTAWDAF